LVDLFPVSHKRMRFSLPNPIFQGGEQVTAAIYDYSSFTSSLTEIYRFTQALSSFFSDTMVEVLDTHFGWHTTSLGNILNDYNQECNINNLVDIGPIMDLPTWLHLYHQAGLLGVPGNITGCTLLHALHLSSVVGSLYLCRCVGDDAFVLLGLSETSQVQWLDFVNRISKLGDIAVEKMETWDLHFPDEPILQLSDTWHYVKRPMGPFGHSIITGEMVITPSLELLIGLKDDYHHPSISLKHDFDRVRSLLSQFHRTLSSIKRREIPLSYQGWEILAQMKKSILAIMRAHDRGSLDKRFKKSASHPTVRYKWHAKYYEVVGQMPVADLPEEFECGSFLDLYYPLADEYITMEVPHLWDGRDEPPMVDSVGFCFVSRTTPLHKVLMKLGILERRDLTRTICLHREHDRGVLDLYLAGMYTAVFEFEVLRSLPVWSI